MTAHNDVMRSDRLKQVMQEIDPNFDEKDAGFSRFSKFVIEAARRGLITLTRLDNGQYEIALGPQVEGDLVLEIGRAHVCTPVTVKSRMPSSSCNKKKSSSLSTALMKASVTFTETFA